MRNVFLTAAQWLRDGAPGGGGGAVTGGGGPSLNPSMARSISTAQWLDLLGIHVDSQQADGMAFSFNLVTPDTGQRFVIEMRHGTLTSLEGFSAVDPDLELTMNRSDLNAVIMGQTSLSQQVQNGVGAAQGDVGVLQQLDSVLATFPSGVEVVPGTIRAN
jgi:alkyl sulfatase BDS1-like metallo-beta-lactamase superfamily hydrolase